MDGSVLKGTVLVQREQTIKDAFGGGEPFVDFECAVSGDIVLARSSVASVRSMKQAQPDHLERRLKMLEKSDACAVLKVAKPADRAKVREAHLALAHAYNPERQAAAGLPPEVVDYLRAMTRRIDSALAELEMLLGPAADSTTIIAAA